MEEADKPKRPARRKKGVRPGRKVTSGRGRSVSFDDQSYQVLSAAASNLNLVKTEYARAAVNYFAERGLDPTQVSSTDGMAEMTQKLGELSQKIDTLQEGARKQSADIGNRLVAIWRTLERNLYTHLGGEQNALYVYLERIEENLLSKLSATESQYLWPLMERVLRGGTDSLMSRRMAGNLLELLKAVVPAGKVADSDVKRINDEHSEARDAEVVRQSRELLEGVKLSERVKSIRPSILVPPNPAVPSKPTPKPTPPPTPA